MSLQMCMFGDDPNCIDPTSGGNETAQDDVIFILGGVLKRESWVLPMLVLSAINVTVILAFEIFVVCKAARYISVNVSTVIYGSVNIIAYSQVAICAVDGTLISRYCEPFYRITFLSRF